jgi:acetolactate synthase-1/2/3 large subunit
MIAKPIILIGPMAAGKSTVAKELARLTGVRNVPMDRVRWYYYFKDGFTLEEELSKPSFKEVMEYNDGPIICDVMTPEWQLLIPRVASEKGADGKLISKPYEDMFPFLPAEELEAAMVVKPKKG